ncbi:MAG: SIR2 family protein [Magnetospirillum sp.]|nr:SIR2 family protein [Magnetospirillum sp.]
MTDAAPRASLSHLAAEVAGGRLIPVLGPDVLTLGDGPPCVPTGARALSHLLASKVGVPGRIKNNLWHTAQYIETHRHRVTLDKLLAEAFKPVPPPSPLHAWLAGLSDAPLIVDTWYDGTMAAALAPRTDWGLIQGTSKARRTGDAPWYRAYDSAGAECPPEAAAAWGTLLYKPHGAAQPVGDVLASDADYVEVLCELDIQTPIPATVQERRQGRGFLFLGCRFYDQILRSFARALMKRSAGPHYAVMPPGEETPNEIRFLAAESIMPLPLPLAEAAAVMTHP